MLIDPITNPEAERLKRHAIHAVGALWLMAFFVGSLDSGISKHIDHDTPLRLARCAIPVAAPQPGYSPLPGYLPIRMMGPTPGYQPFALPAPAAGHVPTALPIIMPGYLPQPGYVPIKFCS